MYDILADRATEGINSVQAMILADWLAGRAESDAEGFDRAAARIALALMPKSDEPLPGRLREKIRTDARLFFAGGKGAE
jgi:hypothetical protein